MCHLLDLPFIAPSPCEKLDISNRLMLPSVYLIIFF